MSSQIRIRWGRIAGLMIAVAAVAAVGGPRPASSPEPWFAPAASPVDEPRETREHGLDRSLRNALRRATDAASGDGVVLSVDSGWRSPEHQQQLLDEAVVKYGSLAEATRWVATPETSAHVSGDAVDIGPADAIAWLSAHGTEYGLCQIYGNEPWHYELRPEAADEGCPPMYPDPTYDPRMNP